MKTTSFVQSNTYALWACVYATECAGWKPITPSTGFTLKRWLWKLKWPHQAIISLALGSFILLYPGQLFCTCPLPVSNTSSAILIFNWQVSFMLHWENRSNKQPNLNQHLHSPTLPLVTVEELSIVLSKAKAFASVLNPLSSHLPQDILIN